MTIDLNTGELDWDVASVASGTYEVDWRVTDDLGASSEQTLVLTVDTSTPLILSKPPETAIAGSLYRYQLLAADFSLTGPLSYSLSLIHI